MEKSDTTVTCPVEINLGEPASVEPSLSPGDSNSSPLVGIDNPTPAETRGAPLGVKIQLRVPGSDYPFEGIIEHFFGGEASILLEHRFQKETRVRIEFDGFHFDGEVLSCQPKGDLFDIHVVLADQDEAGVRRDPRYVVNLDGRIYAPGSVDPIDARLIDISREGIGIECGSPLTVGHMVAVESQLNLAFGVVRHCRQLSSGACRAGLQVHAVITKDTIPMERQRSQPEPKKQRSWMRGILPPF